MRSLCARVVEDGDGFEADEGGANGSGASVVEQVVLLAVGEGARDGVINAGCVLKSELTNESCPTKRTCGTII